MWMRPIAPRFMPSAGAKPGCCFGVLLPMEKALALSCRKAGAGAGGWDPLAAPKAVGSSTFVRPGPLDTELLFGVCPLWPHRAWTGARTSMVFTISSRVREMEKPRSGTTCFFRHQRGEARRLQHMSLAAGLGGLLRAADDEKAPF